MHLRRPDTFNKVRSDHFIRHWRFLKTMLPVYILATVSIGTLWTDFSPVYDRYYDYTPKTTKIM